MPAKEISLQCTACGKTLPLGDASRCPDCGEPLELRFAPTADVSPNGKNFVQRFLGFYPYLDGETLRSLGEGETGLVPLPGLEEALGFEPGALWAKNETQNPTWSFKDRGTFTALNYAKSLGYRRIGVCSSGNMAASCAAYAAALGLEAYIFVPATILEEKVLPIAVYGATVVKVAGDYGRLYGVSAEIGREHGLFFANSDIPLRVEGSKSIALELCRQFDWDPPQWVIVPNSSGGNLRGIEKGFWEARAAGLIQRLPKIVAAQAGGCCPVVRAYEAGQERIRQFETPHTVAHAIENPYPPSGNQLLRLARAGRLASAVAVPEADILPNQRLLAKSGLFVQPAGAVPLGAARILRERGVIAPGERVALIATGSGLKAASVLGSSAHYPVYSTTLEELPAFVKTLL